MLKFIPQHEKNYEESAKGEFGKNSSFLDFFSSEPEEISTKINQTLSEIKSSKKGDIFYNKILYYFSFLLKEEDFKDDDKGKKVIKNLITICEQEVGIKIYQDLFYMLTDEKNNLSFKKEILLQIQKSQIKLGENDFIILYNLFFLYLQDSNFDNEIISILAELLEKNKNYILLKQIENIDKIKLIIRDHYIKNKDSIISNFNLNKLFFYLVITSPDLIDEDVDKITLNEKLVEEKNMFDNLDNLNYTKILFNSDNQKYFEDAYGEKAAELILLGAKESSIHEILIGFEEDKQLTISFKDFIQRIYEEEDSEKKVELSDEEIQNKFEEIEDMIISGNEHKLYNIVIDYLKKEIRILYMRRAEYKKEQKEEVLNKVKEMKTKLEGILRAIEKI